MRCPECDAELQPFAGSCGTGVFAPDGYEEQAWEEVMYCPRCRSVFTDEQEAMEDDQEDWECAFPDKCLMPSLLHHRSECYTVEDAEGYYAEAER